MIRFTCAPALCLLAWFGSALAASAAETDVDLSVGPLLGTHAEAGSRVGVSPATIPILAVTHRVTFVEAFVEGLPVSPAAVSSGGLSTQLTFENAMLRAYAFGDRLAFGAGETLYNQQSTYATEIDASRVAGGRYEIASRPFVNPGVRIAIEYVPVLHGTILPSIPGSRVILHPAYERGSQTEFNVGYRKRNAVTQFEYGIRYVNYVAHFSRTGTLADQNSGVRPYVSFGAHFGRP